MTLTKQQERRMTLSRRQALAGAAGVGVAVALGRRPARAATPTINIG